ncbi:MAG: hypothetical protein QW514_01395 [Thermoprotei archaeon]
MGSELYSLVIDIAFGFHRRMIFQGGRPTPTPPPLRVKPPRQVSSLTTPNHYR